MLTKRGWVPGVALLFLVEGCCTSGRCLDSHSGPDGERATAPRVKTKLVYNDKVDAEARDRTDWRYVMLAQPGKLTVLLHWDNGKATLELDVFDVMGVKVQEGRVWGSGGLRAVVAAEEPGPYYIRVRAAGSEDKSHYSVRALFEPDRSKLKVVCHGCKVGERKCLGEASYIICEQVGPGCTQWTKTFPCPDNVACNNGMCDPCASPCTEKAQRCVGPKQFVVCARKPKDPCPTWSEPKACPPGHRCKDDRCVRGRGRVTGGGTPVQPRPPTPPKPQAGTAPRCKVISIYRYRGVWTLHLECPETANATPGQVGTVLDGETQKPLPGGQIKVTRVSGRYAIATTTLQELGKNRWVRLTPR